jgi:DHA2 family multidrug resistance protein
MEVLDTSIANVALPHIAGSLGASADQSTWVLTSYLVANAIVLPMGAWAASVIGRKNFFMLCIVIFTISSFLVRNRPQPGPPAALPRVSGAGGGGLQPMAQAIMADSFEPSKRGLAFSLYGLVAVLAPSIGPTLGGWITDNYSWHWIFYINIPVGILALFLTNRLVEDPPYQKSDRNNLYRIDYIGVGLLVVAMGALQITLDKGEEKNWFGSNFIVGFGLTFIISFIALILGVSCRKAADGPAAVQVQEFCRMRLSHVADRRTAERDHGAAAAVPAAATRLYGNHRGAVPFGGGLALLVVMPMAGQAVSRFPARNLIAMGFVLFALSYFYTATHISLLISFGFRVVKLRVFQIVAIPFVFISVTTAAYFGIPPEKNNQVSGLINFVRNIGGSILISLTNALVTERAQWHQSQLSKNTTPAGRNYQQQIDALRHTFRRERRQSQWIAPGAGAVVRPASGADAGPGVCRCLLCAGDCRRPDGAHGLSARPQPARRRPVMME